MKDSLRVRVRVHVRVYVARRDTICALDSKNCQIEKSTRARMICETSVASGTHSRTYLKHT